MLKSPFTACFDEAAGRRKALSMEFSDIVVLFR
jgi:hypothetical protein